MSIHPRGIHALLMAAAIVIALAGCPTSKVMITGSVVVHEPIENADLMVYNLQGDLLGRFFNETQQEGTFIISLPQEWCAGGLRIVADDGRLAVSGTDFTDHLVAEVPAPGEGLAPIVHVGLTSTLCAAYRAAHPELTIDEANAIVADFLQLPETVDISHDLIFRDDYFDHELFLTESEQHESLADFISDLVAEIDSSPTSTHTFYDEEAVEKALSAEKGLMGSFATGLAEGAGEAIGSRVTGWALNKIFGPEDSPSRPTDALVLSGIQQLGSDLKSMKADFEAFEGNVRQALTQILTSVEQTDYDTLVTSLNEDISLIDTYTDNFYILCNHTYGNDADFATLARSLRDHLDVLDLEARLRKFNNILSGTQGGASSAIDKWGFLQTRHSQTGRNEQALYAQFQYFTQIQLDLLNLLLEKYHQEYGDASGAGAQNYVNLYQGFMRQQSNIFLSRVEGMMAFMQNWNTSMTAPYLHEWQSYNGGILLKSATRESTVLQAADGIAAEALGLKGGIILRLAAPNYPDSPANPSHINSVALTLRDTRTSQEYVPDYVYKNRVDEPDLGVHTQFRPWDINRYMFLNLPPAEYALKNVNSQYPNPNQNLSTFQLLHSAYLTQTINLGGTGFRNMLITAYCNPQNPV